MDNCIVEIKDNKAILDKEYYFHLLECERCNKEAVEYVNKHKEPLHHNFDEPDCDYWIATNPQDIIDILNGRSDE